MISLGSFPAKCSYDLRDICAKTLFLLPFPFSRKVFAIKFRKMFENVPLPFDHDEGKKNAGEEE